MKFSFLNNEFTLLDKKEDRLLLIVIIFLFSIFFLNVFQPFNIGRWYSDSGAIKFLRLSSYGFVVALVFLFTQFPLRKLLNTEGFKIKTYLFWLTFEIALVSLVYIFLYGNPVGNFINDLLFSVKYTLLGICLPYSFAILLIYYKNQSAEIKTLQNNKVKPYEKRLLVLKDEHDKIKFSLQPENLLMLESTDNYVSVFYLFEGKVQRKLLRNTLKNMEEKLKEYSIIRCHRSFIVNFSHVDFIQKKGKKLILKLKHLEKSIPISTKYLSQFLDFLS